MEHLEANTLTERDFNLLGGQPLNKYRAITGEYTIENMERISAKKSESNGKILILGVLTANWFLGGDHLEEMKLCARGDGHLDFKKELIKISDYRIIVSPLGKILPINNIGRLNNLLPDGEEHYPEPIELPTSERNRTFLLTTFRPKETLSPLKPLSRELRKACLKNKTKNFIIFNNKKENNSSNKQDTSWVKGMEYDPSKERDASWVIDLPHIYIRDNWNKLLNE